MQLTSMFIVFIISDAFLLSLILLFETKEEKVSLISCDFVYLMFYHCISPTSHLVRWLPESPELLLVSSPSISRQ